MTAIEQQVADEMRRRAAMTEIPVPHVEQLVRDGEAVLSRQRRRLGALAAAAAVALLVVGPWLVSTLRDDPGPVDRPPSPSPSPSATSSPGPVTLDDLPEGSPPGVPYLQDGSLHVDGATIATSADQVLAAGSTVLVGRVGQVHASWWLLAGRRLVPVPALDGIFTPQLSPSGDLLAWTSFPDARTTRVTAWSPGTQREVDHVDLDAPYAACCGGGQEVEIYGIDGRDTVYFSQSSGFQAWRPRAGEPHRLTGADAVMQIAPTGPMVQSDGIGLLGKVDDQGHWSKVADLPTDQSATWSPDGALMAYAGDEHGDVLFKQAPTDAWVLDVAGGRKTRLVLPAGVTADALTFESDEHLLVDAFFLPEVHDVLRCSTADGRCERTLPAGQNTWVFPQGLS